MREIKFSGKKVSNGEWVFGSLIKQDNKCYIVIEIETSGNAGDGIDLYALDWYEVIPETVGQFTGLHDKNGKEIYEGDIIEWTDWNGLVHREAVVFDNEWLRFCVFINGVESWRLNKHLANDIEVIGNIHDNKELLEETK